MVVRPDESDILNFTALVGRLAEVTATGQYRDCSVSIEGKDRNRALDKRGLIKTLDELRDHRVDVTWSSTPLRLEFLRNRAHKDASTVAIFGSFLVIPGIKVSSTSTHTSDTS